MHRTCRALLPHWTALLATALCLALLQGGALAAQLEKPIQCAIDADCFIQNYVDLAPGAESADLECGPLSYDKHTGTDFRISYDRMLAGVPVVAAAPGKVRGMRDGMRDASIRQQDAEPVAGRACGNGVALVHPDGMETQYCHLRKGSVRVRPGDTVTAGQVLGLVGLSGQTEFPHLHFEVRRNGQAVCPFTGRTLESGCGEKQRRPLWTGTALGAMPYIPVGALEAGFSGGQPDAKTLFTGGRPPALSRRSPQLHLWAGFWGVRKGDAITMRITTPSGEVWTRSRHVVQHAQAQLVLYMGKKTATPWPAGSYKGEAVLERPGNGAAPLVIPLAIAITLPENPAD